jgi:ubiquinone/menaquinone biosynthesis C-methylase UbiE
MALDTKNPTQKRKRRRKVLRNIVEFKGIRRLPIGEYRSNIRKLYDGPAGGVLAIGSLISMHQPLVGHMIRSRKFDVTRHRQILDVGSGAGQILGHLSHEVEPNTRLVAYDLSHQMLRRARNRLGNRLPAYIAGDMLQLPFVDNSFDCVTCGWVIEHLSDPKPGLSELGRVLQPGGRLLLLATEDTLSGAVVSRTWKCRTYNRRELQQACEEVGLPWQQQLWFSKIHRFFRMGGILVQITKPNGEVDS